jgi:hypothetical protein
MVLFQYIDCTLILFCFPAIFKAHVGLYSGPDRLLCGLYDRARPSDAFRECSLDMGPLLEGLEGSQSGRPECCQGTYRKCMVRSVLQADQLEHLPLHLEFHCVRSFRLSLLETAV